MGNYGQFCGELKKLSMEKFTLLDSTYTPDQAREVVLTLISDKIRFLNMQSLRIREMYSGDTSHLEERIEDLKKSKKEIEAILDAAKNEGKDVSFSSEISVKLVNKAPVESA